MSGRLPPNPRLPTNIPMAPSALQRPDIPLTCRESSTPIRDQAAGSSRAQNGRRSVSLWPGEPRSKRREVPLPNTHRRAMHAGGYPRIFDRGLILRNGLVPPPRGTTDHQPGRRPRNVSAFRRAVRGANRTTNQPSLTGERLRSCPARQRPLSMPVFRLPHRLSEAALLRHRPRLLAVFARRSNCVSTSLRPGSSQRSSSIG